MMGVAAILAVGAVACAVTDPSAGVDPELTCDGATKLVTMAQLHTEVIAPRCTSCHPNNGAPGNYGTPATTHAALVGRTSAHAGAAGTMKIVDGTNLANSTLWLKVLGGDSANRRGPHGETTSQPMPPLGLPRLDRDKVQRIKDWICSGANP